MRGAPRSILFTLAAACWVAAGPAGVTVREVLACHHAAHHMAGQHPTTPPQGPCFCDQMTGGSDLVVSEAMPAPPAVPPVTAFVMQLANHQSAFPLPSSPAFPPASPPPIRLG